MVIYGLSSTLAVTLDMMIAHGRAVVTSTSHALSSSTCRSAAIRPPRAGVPVGRAHHVGNRLRRGQARRRHRDGRRFLPGRPRRPVMGHVGLTPQAVNTLGGYKAAAATPGGRAHHRRRQGHRRRRRVLHRGRGHHRPGGRARSPPPSPFPPSASAPRPLRRPVLVIDDVLAVRRFPPKARKVLCRSRPLDRRRRQILRSRREGAPLSRSGECLWPIQSQRLNIP